MLQAKLASYSKEEVDYLLKSMTEVFSFLQDDCPQLGYCTACLNCKYRHICKDLFEIVDFLETEQRENYPHIHQRKGVKK